MTSHIIPFVIHIYSLLAVTSQEILMTYKSALREIERRLSRLGLGTCPHASPFGNMYLMFSFSGGLVVDYSRLVCLSTTVYDTI